MLAEVLSDPVGPVAREEGPGGILAVAPDGGVDVAVRVGASVEEAGKESEDVFLVVGVAVGVEEEEGGGEVVVVIDDEAEVGGRFAGDVLRHLEVLGGRIRRLGVDDVRVVRNVGEPGEGVGVVRENEDEGEGGH